MPTVQIQNHRIAYTLQGQGQPIVLLHGYLESKEVWTSFAQELAKHHQVLCIDIPGHGESDTMQETHSMELLADVLHATLAKLHINNSTLIGHSMGGYLALAYADKYPDHIKNLVLFHSGVFADTAEKKVNRQREIELIQQGKLELILRNNLPKMFANENVPQQQEALEKITEAATKHDPQGICALLRGMMQREDKQAFVQKFTKPMLFIFGEKDNYIPLEAGKKMLALNPKIEALWLKESGHMGFLEEPEKTVEGLQAFLAAHHT